MGRGFVYLVGAGPGDSKLITLRGLECIKKADVVVYDRLVSPRLLGYAKKDAELIYVGKDPLNHTVPQDEINRILVDKALEGHVVTRLKGGDPFVFGRGGEEAEFLLAHRLSFEVVPGVTSAVSVPAYAGIPVTHRGFASSFAVITGNEDVNKVDSTIRWDKLSLGTDTLVFLMGMANLPKIVEKLLEFGRPGETPIALIRWGTRPEQETLTGTLADIVGRVKEANFKNPAVIVVGKVVALRDKLKWFEAKPLFGKRVIVTRSRSQASVLSEKIDELGGEPFEFPSIDIVEPDDFTPLDNAIKDIQNFHWIIFTSTNGVEYFFNRMKKLRKDVRDLRGINICAIGPKTEEEIEKYGLFCDLVPDEFVAEALIDEFKHYNIKGKNILLPRANIARKILPDTLQEWGANVYDVHAYKTVLGNGDRQTLKKMLKQKQIQIATFTSSSTVRNFVTMLEEDNYQELLENVQIACIGPITAQTARDLGLRVDVEAKVYTIEGLLNSILEVK